VDPRTGQLQHTKPAYTLSIGSVESFEKQLEEVQKLLEIASHKYIPITYASTTDWYARTHARAHLGVCDTVPGCGCGWGGG
jgi:hypothetical protein